MKVIFLVCACLLSSSWGSPSSRVIGGNNAISGQFPFAAAIHINTNNGRYFCGGTLISNEWVITAAQCVDGATLFSIQLGSNSLEVSDSNRVTVATSDYIIHPDYNPATLENDIALIKLRMPVEFSNYLLPIHSLAEEALEPSVRVVVIGWGQTSDEDAGLSDNLRYVPVTTLTNEECSLIYGSQIADNMVCVEGNYNEGSCHGDTGGALVRVIAMGNAQLVGIAGFISGNGCESTDPSGYTRVFPYVDWIKNNTELTFN